MATRVKHGNKSETWQQATPWTAVSFEELCTNTTLGELQIAKLQAYASVAMVTMFQY